MNRFNSILLLALTAQLVLAGMIYQSNHSQSKELQSRPLLTLKAEDITSISIQESGKEAVDLEKEIDTWKLESLQGLPVKPTGVDDLLQLFADIRTTWPVTTSTSSHERFKVEEEGFAKRLTLSTQDGDTQILYLGSSPGFRQLHLRREGEDNVYSAKLESYKISGNANDWLDRGLLALSDEIEAIEVDEMMLLRTDQGWTFRDRKSAVNQAEADNLAKTLKGLRVLDAAELDLDNPQSAFSLTVAGKRYNYRLFGDDEYYLGRDDFDTLFKIDKSDFDTLTGLAVERLAEKETETDGSETGGNESQDTADSESQSAPSS